MIKLSNDNSGFWRTFFGGGLVIMHMLFIAFVIVVNFWLIYMFYLFFAIMHFFVARVWRYLLIQDVYLSLDHKEVEFKSLNGRDSRFSCAQIVQLSTKAGITDVTVDDSGQLKKFYFMINSKENLKFLTETT